MAQKRIYKNLIKGFYRLGLDKKLSENATKLFFALLKEAERYGFPDTPIEISDQKLCSLCDFDKTL